MKAEPEPEAPKKSKKVAISYDKYMTIMQKVVYMLADAESKTSTGMHRSAVIVQYLEDVEGELQDPEAAEMEEVLIKKVLTKLVKVRPPAAFSLLLGSFRRRLTLFRGLQEKYLLELRGEGLKEGMDEQSESDPDPILTVHPECDVL